MSRQSIPDILFGGAKVRKIEGPRIEVQFQFKEQWTNFDSCHMVWSQSFDISEKAENNLGSTTEKPILRPATLDNLPYRIETERLVLTRSERDFLGHGGLLAPRSCKRMQLETSTWRDNRRIMNIIKTKNEKLKFFYNNDVHPHGGRVHHLNHMLAF